MGALWAQGVAVMVAAGYVYFLQAQPDGPIKIGHTSRAPQERLQCLRMMSPQPLTPLGVVVGGLDAERSLHRRFAAIRLHGEWFRPDDALLHFIAEEAQAWPEGVTTAQMREAAKAPEEPRDETGDRIAEITKRIAQLRSWRQSRLKFSRKVLQEREDMAVELEAELERLRSH